ASSPAVGADGTVFFGAMDGKLSAVSASGRALWQVQTGGQVNSSPAIGADGAVFAASDDGFLYAVE
ncbi:MAG: outer membrane protein assembly factor BamB family protein, partial [Myxococcales bacterium]